MERYTPLTVREVAAILYASANPGRSAITIQAISNWQCSAQQGMVEMRARYTFLLANTRTDEIIIERSPPIVKAITKAITKATLRRKVWAAGISTGESREGPR
jgi:hypothetical protein